MIYFREGFDEVLEADQWIMGKQDNTYVALYSYQPTVWAQEPRRDFKCMFIKHSQFSLLVSL